MTSFYADSFHYFSNKPDSVCAFLATNRSIFNSSIIPVTLNIKDLWESLRRAVYFSGVESTEQSLLEVLSLSHTLQFAPSLLFGESITSLFLNKMLTTLIKERRYFCRTLKHIQIRDPECATIVVENVHSLETLDLRAIYTDHVLTAIGKLPMLTSLTLANGFFQSTEDASLQPLLMLTSLVKLDLSYCFGLRGCDLVQLENMKLLQELDLIDCRLPSKAFSQLPHFPALLVLNISRTKIHDSSLEAVTKQKTLRTLNISYCPNISSKGLERVCNTLEYLSDLNLQDNTKINDSGLLVLTSANKTSLSLKRLNLGESQISDNGVSRLVAEMVDLECLELESCRGLTDVSLEAISKLERMKELNLRFNQGFSERGFQHLLKLPRLEKVQVNFYSYTGERDARSLSTISTHQGLRFLGVLLQGDVSVELTKRVLLIMVKATWLEKVTVYSRVGLDFVALIRDNVKLLTGLHLPFSVVCKDLSRGTSFVVPR